MVHLDAVHAEVKHSANNGVIAHQTGGKTASRRRL
jgi:hypothetical protein